LHLFSLKMDAVGSSRQLLKLLQKYPDSHQVHENLPIIASNLIMLQRETCLPNTRRFKKSLISKMEALNFSPNFDNCLICYMTLTPGHTILHSYVPDNFRPYKRHCDNKFYLSTQISSFSCDICTFGRKTDPRS